jgi:hypothetical protein
MINIDIPDRDEKPTSIFNPLKTDFKCTYRDDDNKPREYIVRSMEIETFPAYIAKHIVKHLIVAVQNERSVNSLNTKAIEEIRKEIEINGLE